jgi:hypothetical protein
MNRQNNASVQKHRAKMAEEECARMEVTLQRGLIKQARALARQKRCPLWLVVQDALLAFVATGNAASSNAATGNVK